MSAVRVTVNGEPREVAPGATVAAVADEVAGDLVGHNAGGDAGAPSRVAVAVNGEVVARAGWAHTELTDGDRVEIVAAIQGGR